MDIPKIQVNNASVRNIGTTRVFVNDVPDWLTRQPLHSIPFVPPATVNIGQPIIQMPGCVEAHEQSGKNNEIIEDDDDKVLVFCDAEYPSYDAMDYQPDQLQMVIEAPPPPVVEPPPTPEVGTPEVPPLPKDDKEIDCPAPNQPRVGDLTQNGEERVIGHEIREGQCVVLYEDTTAIQRFLPTTNQASVTAAIAVVATASAAATPLLLRIFKPVITKLWKTIQKKLGKKVDPPTRAEIKTNEYRQKKGLPPLKKK